MKIRCFSKVPATASSTLEGKVRPLLKMKTRQAGLAVLLTTLLLPGAAWAQTSIASWFNPLSASSPGAHFYGVTIFSGYYTGAQGIGIPGIGGLAPQTPDSPTYEVATGATASFGWSRSTKDTHVSIVYSPTYVRSLHYSYSNFFSPSFSVSANKHLSLTRKWSLNLSTSASLSELRQLLFNPGALNAAGSIPASFDDFSTAVLAGAYTNTQLASILTSTPTAAAPSPEQTFLYGNRVLALSAGTNLSYTISQRSSLQFGFTAWRSQTLGNSGASSTGPGYLVPETTGGGANFAWNYSLTPRTEITASMTASRSFSHLQDGYATSGNFSIGRTMSRRWFIRGGVGAGMLFYNRHSFAVPSSIQYLGNASLGYKTYAHSFFVSYNRSLGDAYGVGSGSTSGASGTWSWKPPASAWGVYGSGGWQRLANVTLNNPASWVGAAGAARALGARMFLSAQFSYFRFPFAVLAQTGLSQRAASVALTWAPSYQ